MWTPSIRPVAIGSDHTAFPSWSLSLPPVQLGNDHRQLPLEPWSRRTSRLTVTTDPSPTILDGVPTDLRTINAVIDRPGFMFNPINREPQQFSGTATSNQGAVLPISSDFQLGSVATSH